MFCNTETEKTCSCNDLDNTGKNEKLLSSETSSLNVVLVHRRSSMVQIINEHMNEERGCCWNDSDNLIPVPFNSWVCAWLVVLWCILESSVQCPTPVTHTRTHTHTQLWPLPHVKVHLIVILSVENKDQHTVTLVLHAENSSLLISPRINRRKSGFCFRTVRLLMSFERFLNSLYLHLYLAFCTLLTS